MTMRLTMAIEQDEVAVTNVKSHTIIRREEEEEEQNKKQRQEEGEKRSMKKKWKVANPGKASASFCLTAEKLTACPSRTPPTMGIRAETRTLTATGPFPRQPHCDGGIGKRFVGQCKMCQSISIFRCNTTFLLGNNSALRRHPLASLRLTTYLVLYTSSRYKNSVTP